MQEQVNNEVEEGIVSQIIGMVIVLAFFVAVLSPIAGFIEGDVTKNGPDVIVIDAGDNGKPHKLESWYVFSSRKDFLLGVPALVNGWYGLQVPDVIEAKGVSIPVGDMVAGGDNVIVNVSDKTMYYSYVFYGPGKPEIKYPNDANFVVEIPPGEAVNVGKHTIFTDFFGCASAPVFLQTQSSKELQKLGYLTQRDPSGDC